MLAKRLAQLMSKKLHSQVVFIKINEFKNYP